MRKLSLGTFVIIIFMAAMGMAGFATPLSDKQDELGRIKDYVTQVDRQIAAAKAEKDNQRVSQLKQMKVEALQEASRLRDEIDQLSLQEAPAAVTPAPVEPTQPVVPPAPVIETPAVVAPVAEPPVVKAPVVAPPVVAPPVVVAAPAPASSLRDKKNELGKIGDQMDLLSQQIAVARSRNDTRRVAELKQMKAEAAQKAARLRAEIAQLSQEETPAAADAAPVEYPVVGNPMPVMGKPTIKELRRRRLYLGYTGGAGLLALETPVVFRKSEFMTSVGFGLGNGYSLIEAGALTTRPMGNNYGGLELKLFYFSQAVNNIPGIAVINQGANLGLGVFYGAKIKGVDVRIGYNTAVGINIGAVKEL